MTTLREILFGGTGRAGELADQTEQAANRLVEAGAVPGGNNVAQAVVRKAGELLDIEISDVVVGAWRTGSALLDAARQTRAEQGTSQEVTLHTYSFGWDQESDVEVNVNRFTIAEMTLLATTQADLTALAVTVHNGCITAVHHGNLDVSADVRVRINAMRTPKGDTASATRLPLGGLTLAEGSRTVDLRYEVRLPAAGIPLL